MHSSHASVMFVISQTLEQFHDVAFVLIMPFTKIPDDAPMISF